MDNAYIVGQTTSSNFPTVNAFQASFGGGSIDAFVTKLAPDGSALIFSTYLGGDGNDDIRGIAVDIAEQAYVTGESLSSNFPTTPGAFSTPGQGGLFITKFSAAGSTLEYSTNFGGFGADSGQAIAVDTDGNAYVTGGTISPDFPTVNPVQASFGGGSGDAIAVKLNPSGSALVYSTFLGGSNNENGRDIAIDADRNAYLIGTTLSNDFPTANPLQPTFGGLRDMFVTKLVPAGSAFAYSTYLGGSSADDGNGITVDSTRNARVIGQTFSIDFPTLDSIQADTPGADMVVATLNSSGAGLLFSTYLGGGGGDTGNAIGLDAVGSMYVTGTTGSGGFPTTPGAFQIGIGGGAFDAFVAKIADIVFVVNSTGDNPDANLADGVCDDGTGVFCTLRAAIEQANASADLNRIHFDIPSGGTQTIQPASPLPFVAAPVVIDGTTQPGFTGTPIIELDGSFVSGAATNGLVITAGTSTVRGLVINHFPRDGITLAINGGNSIQGNFLGTDLTGTLEKRNHRFGVVISNIAN